MSEFTGWLMSTKEDSLDKKIDRVRTALYEKLNPRVDMPYGMGMVSQRPYQSFWVGEIYSDYAIVSKGEDFFKVTYSVADDGTVTVSDTLTPVEKVWREKVQ